MRWEQIPAARRQDDQTPRPANLSIAAWPAGTMRRSPAAITHPVLHPTMTLNNNGNGRNGASLGFEADLFKAADKLRGNMEPSDYKHVALGLIFLKYISDAFEARHAALLAEDAQAAEDRDEYLADNIFWVPKDARWSHLKAAAKRPEIGQLIDDAMRAIERDNESLKGVLPKDYARPALNKLMLGELIDLISGIALRQPSPPAPLPEGEGRATAQSSPLPLGEGGRRPGEGQV
jgi:hypothetical protein